MSRILLISNSTVYGRGYLDHVEAAIKVFLGPARRVAFIPYALYDQAGYAAKAGERFARLGYELISVHASPDPARTLAECDAVFIGGGNTFRLLTRLYEHHLLEPIRERIAAGVPYIGSSAGSIVAGPSLRTTKDMPILQPPSFDALGLVPFQISPHYLDPDPASRHMGETQEERILQFLEENTAPVAGLREGSWIEVNGRSMTLAGEFNVRIFRRGHPPLECEPGPGLERYLVPESQ